MGDTMSDRNRPPEPTPDDEYHGQERRKPPGLGTELHRALPAMAAGAAAGVEAARDAREPDWWRKLPSSWRSGIQIGAIGVIISLFVLDRVDSREAIRTANGERRADLLEEREMRRAEQTQHSRDSAAIQAKFDALVSEMRAFAAKVDASSDRVATVRASMEQMNARVEEVLNRLFAELKRLTPAPRKTTPMDKPTGVDAGEIGGGFFNPIWWLVDHAPPKVMDPPTELAPRPRIIPRPTDDSPAH